MKLRQNLYLDIDVIVSLDQLARAVRRGDRRANKSRIASALLRDGIAARGVKQIDSHIKPATDRMTRELAKVSRSAEIHFEAFMLLVEHMLTVTAAVRDDDRTAKAAGQERFQRFIEALGRRLADGGTDLAATSDAESS